MAKCGDPCGDCKPRCEKKNSCINYFESSSGIKTPPCPCNECQHENCNCCNCSKCKKKINCIVPCNENSECGQNDCQNNLKCAVSCENKSDCSDYQKYNCRVSCENNKCARHTHHIHEIIGSTILSGCKIHNHRFATVSGESIKTCESHVHEVEFKTDYAGHYHKFKGFTGPAIDLPDGKHTHFLKACTSVDDSHKHEFIVSSLIENPTNIYFH